MAPKVKVTREDIVEASVGIVRMVSIESLNARAIATALNCSTQPIFSNFASMEELHLAVIERAYSIYQGYLQREVDEGIYPTYKATGMAYIRFAKEERELFKLLFMCDRSEQQDFGKWEFDDMTLDIVRNSTGLDENTMKFFHLEVWAYVHGIATMFATGFLDLDWDLVSRMLTDAYLGLRKQYGME